jgi:hypothetical protein
MIEAFLLLRRGRSKIQAMPTLVVDPWHWLTEDGRLPVDDPGLYRRILRVARFIEYGGQLRQGQARGTLLQCKRRPKGRACAGLLWVTKTDADAIVATCPRCRKDEAIIHNWQETAWANGMMKALSVHDERTATAH